MTTSRDRWRRTRAELLAQIEAVLAELDVLRAMLVELSRARGPGS